MKRQLEPVDLMVAIGLCATLLGGYFLFMATSGAIGAVSTETASVGLTGSMGPRSGETITAAEWVQPALGQAIVTDYLLEQRASGMTAAASAEFNRATLIGQRLAPALAEHFKQIGAHAAAVDADHAARVQYVLGNRIVHFTARGVRAGLLSPKQINDRYNRRMIRMTQLAANRMDDQFLSSREPVKGWAIVTASQDYVQYTGQVQQRIGRAVVRVAQVQQTFGDALAGAQEQLASVALASIHSEQIADRFTRLAAADISAGAPSLPLNEPRPWPEVPIGFLLAASVTLIGLFFVGLFLPSAGPETGMMDDTQVEPAEKPYRKTG